jgi:hypothetical protein
MSVLDSKDLYEFLMYSMRSYDRGRIRFRDLLEP